MHNRLLANMLCILLAFGSCLALAQENPDPKAIVRAALDHWRGLSSYSEMTMTIHRPDWERSMSMRAWTRGDDYSLVRVTAPAKDSGSGTLLIDNEMWTYAPKINRVIKVPSSMMGQSWMGSDFSNKDIARADDIVDQYNHKLLKTEEVDGHTVYHIEAIPKENAPVVWGREVLQIRDDYVMLREDFYDQDNELVKSMVTDDIAMMDGRPVARVQRMSNVDEPDKWTQVEVKEVDFEVDLPDRLFTLSNLRNPRQ
ncbi:outer membrane lipoprotein-sorting protein [Proteobacteria bacterium 005FR1]|nr:outer membrane lipoprotein-sorting protein [Proteobacteria bacterium 005FR1]